MQRKIIQNYSSRQWWNHCKAKVSLADPYTCISLASLYLCARWNKISLCSGFIIVYLNSVVLFSFAFLFQWLLIQAVYNLPQNFDFQHMLHFLHDIMSQWGEKRKRGVYNTKTIQEKAAACCDLEGGMALWCLSKKYVSKSTAVSWCKQEDNILTDANKVRKDIDTESPLLPQ